MQRVWEHCKGKKVCEADEVMKDENDDVMDGQTREGRRGHGHGGCGHIQPDIRKEGLKLFLVYKRNSDDDDGVNIFLTRRRVTPPLSWIRHADRVPFI